MKVSVVMPVFNKAPFLREALDSVLRGTFSELEVIAVDDKSTDESLSILRSINDPRLRIIELATNRGPAGAANAGLDAATGEYIVRLDADDIMVPDRIVRQVAYMDAHPGVGASGSALALFGSTDVTWRFPTENDEAQAQLLFGVPISQGASILRRSVLEQHQLRYDPAWPRIGEDWLFWARMSRVTSLGNLPDVLTLYRRGEQNISHGQDKVKYNEVILGILFGFLALPFTADQLELHLMAMKLFKRPPTVERIRALRAWLDGLLAMNAERSTFPQEAFVRRVEMAWDGLFHYLPRYGTAVAVEHLRISRSWSLDRIKYIAKYRVNALLGRVRNG